MKDEIKNGKNVSLDGITVINEGVSLSEKKEVKEEVTPVVEETKNEEPVITPDVQINSTPVAPVTEPVVSMPEPPIIEQTVSPAIEAPVMGTPIIPNYGMDTCVNPMPEASPVAPSYDYPSFGNNSYESYNMNSQGSSMFDNLNFDFSTEEGIKEAFDVLDKITKILSEATENINKAAVKLCKEKNGYKDHIDNLSNMIRYVPDNGGNTPKF